ncbi:major facilitator transporter, partial [Pseudomonas syringae pv. japonica str. M301072]
MRFILLILGLDVLGIGLAIPVMPTLIATIWPSSAEHVSLALGVALTLYSAMQFLCAPLLGALSDCHGRRPILLLALAGMCLGNLMAGFAGSLTVLLIGRAIAGITAA